MKLLGHRVYLELPSKEKSKLVVDENTKEALEREMIIKMSKLKVVEVGNVVELIKKGDFVLVDPEALTKAKIIPLENNESVLLVGYFDVIHVW